MSDSYDKPPPDTLITSPNPASSPEFNDLALEICMATVALKGIRAGEPYIAKRPAKNLTAMQHVVSLLSTGTPEELSRLEQDISASQVIAVTGATNVSGRLEGLVLADRNTRGRPLEESDTLKITVEPLKSRLTGEKILAQWRTRPPEHHLEDVFAIIKDFQSGACPSTGNNQALFCALYLSHGYPKIAGRMLHLYKRQLWGKHPIDVLESRLISGEPFTLTQGRPWTVYVNSAATLAKLQKYGISRPSQADTVAYSVTAEEVPKWIRAFTSTYREIEGKLLNADRKSYKYPADVRDIGSAVIPLECLRGFLDSNFLRDLLQDEALSLALAKRPGSGSETSDVSGDGDPDLNEEDKVDPDDRQDPEESIGHHVIRYLKTITAPVTAIHSLARKAQRPSSRKGRHLSTPSMCSSVAQSKRKIMLRGSWTRD
ncbi:hypothetical protein FA95DRAFT_1556004 [Auriscalpium vulgare]|uniref:Uncharacterized protein n=1 Tax=Auriscalpium vulgare TaxID=40419 RepID=A0ACB8S0W9_9AGAM|nr:hypothetical protein FA95DRAFT_1556004 [Auriscalpium vulgare]